MQIPKGACDGLLSFMLKKADDLKVQRVRAKNNYQDFVYGIEELSEEGGESDEGMDSSAEEEEEEGGAECWGWECTRIQGQFVTCI